MEKNSLEDKIEILSQLAEEKKAEEIEVISVAGVSNMTDCYLICSGDGSIHTKTIAKHIISETKKIGFRLHHKEGLENGTWILIDFGSVVVHIFEKKAREYYQLGDFWNEMIEKKLSRSRTKSDKE